VPGVKQRGLYRISAIRISLIKQKNSHAECAEFAEWEPKQEFLTTDGKGFTQIIGKNFWNL
jgi:hypothetical protein